MRGNCFESEQIWWREIRADDGGGGVIRIRVGGRGLKRVEGCGGGGLVGVGGGGGGRGGRWGWWVRAFARTPYDCVCVCVCVCACWSVCVYLRLGCEIFPPERQRVELGGKMRRWVV